MINIAIIIFTILFSSIPFGLILTKIIYKQDIRQIGSGNIGATNVLRSGKKILSLITLSLDIFKGFIPVFLATNFANNTNIILLAAFLAVISHIFPIWNKFKGGKGVATLIGVLIAFDPFLALIYCVLWLAMFYLTKISSLSSIFSTFCLPFFAILFFNNKLYYLLFIILSTIVIIKHKENIKRILKKQENKISFKESKNGNK